MESDSQAPTSPPSNAQSPQFSILIESTEPISRASTLPVALSQAGTHLPHRTLLPHPNSRVSIPHSYASSIPNADVHTGKSWSESVDDPWLPLILTCDGGGIRGYSSLLILAQLMEQVAIWENYFEDLQTVPGLRHHFVADDLLPCHYFDFMYGTSTGGLIATMLGRLRMRLSDCIVAYKEVGDELFGHRRSKMPLGTKYRERPLEDAVKRIVQKHCPVSHPSHGTDGLDWNPWILDQDETADANDEEPFHPDINTRICQSICLTADHNNDVTKAYLLRTYNHRYNIDTPNYAARYNEGADKLQIWQVTRATSAAPFYFKSLFADIAGVRKEFKDGGIRENNPSIAAWSEFVSVYGDDKDPALLLSIGTGRPNMEKDGFTTVWPGPFGRLGLVKKFAETSAVLQNMLVRYTEGESRHRDMTMLARGQFRWYKRLNVSSGLETLRLDNWEQSVHRNPETHEQTVIPGGKTLRKLEEQTAAYLARTDVDPALMEYTTPMTMIQQIAQKIVRHRRAREAAASCDSGRWHHFLGGGLASSTFQTSRTPSPPHTVAGASPSGTA